ncbi:LytTR family DNA-binding domain-containing protein [Sphingomonas sp.]|uniref:LytTR family DNA-binding domain-containing protein n=1 Tax=Sphingomonas sp. TaxID=28214 RepID=UPI003B3A5D73
MRDFAKMREAARGVDAQGRVAIALIVGILFGWLGPFDTDELPLFTNLGFWTSMCLLWFVVSSPIEIALASFWDGWPRRTQWERLLLKVLLAAPIAASLATFALDRLDRWEPSLFEMADLLSQTIVIGGLLEMIAAATLGGRGSPFMREARIATAGPVAGAGAPATVIDPTHDKPDRQENAAIAPSPLVDRLPPSVRGTVLCLQMQDHYVRIYTDRGSHLVLMRLKDAIAELNGTDGLQVHRSWWAARAAIRSVSRTGRTTILTLSNGLTVPVSQPYIADVLAVLPA